MTETQIRELIDEWGGLLMKIGPKLDRIAKIEKDVKAWLKASPRKKVQVTGQYAVATKDEKLGDRQLTVDAFVEAAAEKTEEERAACLKVELKKAEALLGKSAIDKLATRPTVPDISLKLKEV